MFSFPFNTPTPLHSVHTPIDLPTSDAVHKCTCTTRADVQWIHCTGARAVKKNWIFFFGPFWSLFHPLVWHSLPEAKTIVFSLQKKQTLLKKALWKTRNIAALPCSRVWRPGLRRRFQWRKGSCSRTVSGVPTQSHKLHLRVHVYHRLLRVRDEEDNTRHVHVHQYLLVPVRDLHHMYVHVVLQWRMWLRLPPGMESFVYYESRKNW